MGNDIIEKPLVSIIVPIYNAERFLSDCLNSIEQQTFKNFEVICVNDGSKDNSIEICQKWVNRDKRFKLFNQDNRGVSAARNKGLDIATGQYVCFIDSDDMVAPFYLSHLLSVASDGSFPICSYATNINKMIENHNTVKKYIAEDFIHHIIYETRTHPNLWAMLFKYCLIRENNITFTEGCFVNEDTEFFVKYLIYENRVCVTDTKAYYYRINPMSVMRSPMTIKALTSIEASQRINKLLFDKGVINDEIIVVSNGVLNYAYSLSKDRNKELYEYLHDHYDVKGAMKKMLVFPRLSKKMVAFFYLLVGKTNFFNIVGLQTFLKK